MLCLIVCMCLLCVHVRVCAGIIPMKDYVLAEELLSNDSTHAAGMQGQPHSLDDLTDGQLEDRFYQSVIDTSL